MSMKTYVEAIDFVLDSELDARRDLICLRPGARRALSEAERDLPLPRIGVKSVSVALGAALCGMHPVLDLMQESSAAQLLADAFYDLPVGMTPAMTVIVCAEDKEKIMDLPGAYVLQPKTPRQAAGFLRSALKLEKLTVLLADQTLFAEADDVPEERSFTLLPLEEPSVEEKTDDQAAEKAAESGITEEQAYEEAENEEVRVITMTEEKAFEEMEAGRVRVPAMTEEDAYEEAEAEDVRVIEGDDEEDEAAVRQDTEIDPMVLDPRQDEPKHVFVRADEEDLAAHKPGAFCASRSVPCDLTALRSLCALLEMDDEAMVTRCAGHVLPLYGGFELHYEADAPEGEAAFLPPVEENASIWLGSNMLTVSYDAAQMKHADAAQLLRAVKRVLEKPQLLIYDKEYDEA